MEMNTQTENKMVINALVGRPVLWDGGLGEMDTQVLSILRKRSQPATPVMLARLTGYARNEVNSCLLRLKRRDLARPSAAYGTWVAV